jgi:predicted Fe-S protein YdhL (DUF1289 family)
MQPAAPVASPCVGICRLAQGTRICEGCHRTVEEITAWSRAGEDERRRIVREAATRRAAALFPRQGSD